MSGLPRVDTLRRQAQKVARETSPPRGVRPEKLAEGDISVHAAQHKTGGTDALAAADIGAAPRVHDHGTPVLVLAGGGELTISSGVITKSANHHTVDTEADAATDDLDTINGGGDGDLLVLTAADSARTVVVKDGTGNLALNGDMSLDNAQDTIMFIFFGGTWLELSRSNNGA